MLSVRCRRGARGADAGRARELRDRCDASEYAVEEHRRAQLRLNDELAAAQQQASAIGPVDGPVVAEVRGADDAPGEAPRPDDPVPAEVLLGVELPAPAVGAAT